jgi:ppGpp synthetase/RelA/SpoT-type nucleotidyltranferase
MNLDEEYKSNISKYTKLKNEIQFIIDDEILNRDIKIHSLTSRIKTFNSFNDKVKRKKILKPFKEIQDIVGLRVVVLLRSDLEKIEKLISENFDIIAKDNKINNMDTSSFGYMSNHFIVKLKDVYNGPRYNFIKDLVCEIQIRTIAMDAWATISHYLDYKTEHDIPKELKKDFYALSGLFYVADTHFELFYKERDESKHKAEKEIIKNKNIEINLDTLSAYLQDKFPDRRQSDTSTLSELVNELYEYGYKDIYSLNKDIVLSNKAFLEYEKEHPPTDINKDLPTKFQTVGIVRVILELLNPDKNRLGDDTMDEYRVYIKK